MADWTNLPLEILALIAERLPFLEDFVFFCAVCKSWQSVTSILEKNPSLATRYPRLMLAETVATKGHGYQDVPVRYFRNLLTSKSYELNLPEVCGRRCFGTHYGWMMTTGYDLQINLLHPFSRQRISLPPFLTFPDLREYDETYPPQRDVFKCFVKKMAMSSSPRKENNLPNHNHQCVLVAIYGVFDRLAFARLGDNVWKGISVPSNCYEDIIYYNDKFYAVDCHGVVVVCDIDDKNGPRATIVAPAPSETRDSYQKYLVESLGDLLLVSRIRGGTLFEPDADNEDDEDNDNDYEGEDDDDDNENKDNIRSATYYTIDFSVVKLEECQEEGNNYAYKLTEVTTLGDRALFLGSNVSKSVSSSKSIKPNCIYFTDDNCGEYTDIEEYPPGHDTGIFNMEDRTIQSKYAGEFYSCFSPPLWYI